MQGSAAVGVLLVHVGTAVDQQPGGLGFSSHHGPGQGADSLAIQCVDILDFVQPFFQRRDFACPGRLPEIRFFPVRHLGARQAIMLSKNRDDLGATGPHLVHVDADLQQSGNELDEALDLVTPWR